MPHKRAKRSVRELEKTKNGIDHVPTKFTILQEDIPKRLSRVLDAERLRTEFKNKRKREEPGDPQMRKRLKTGDEIEIKPGESLLHFNRRVEDDLRPVVRTAIQRSKKKGKTRSHAGEDVTLAADPQPTEERTGKTEFEELPKATRLNDIVMAPPNLKKLPRRNAQTRNKEGKTSVIPLVQRQMMDMERDRAIARYRELRERQRKEHDADVR